MTQAYSGKAVKLNDNYVASNLSTLARQVDSGGVTALHLVAKTGSLAKAQKLLEFGALSDATIKNSNYTPLHVAIKNNHTDVALVLIEHMVEEHNLAGLNARTASGFSAFQMAAKHNMPNVLDALVSAGVDIELSSHPKENSVSKVAKATAGWLERLSAFSVKPVNVQHSANNQSAEVALPRAGVK